MVDNSLPCDRTDCKNLSTSNNDDSGYNTSGLLENSLLDLKTLEAQCVNEQSQLESVNTSETMEFSETNINTDTFLMHADENSLGLEQPELPELSNSPMNDTFRMDSE